MMMIRFFSLQRLDRTYAVARRFASSEATTPVSTSGRGTGFFQRLSSFTVGAGVTALVSQYYIYDELVEGNKIILAKQKVLEKRVKALEGKK